MKVLWLRPSKGDNISVRRERIAEKLEAKDFSITIMDASGFDMFSAIWTAIRGDFDIIAGNVRVGLYIGFPLARLLKKPFLGDVSDPISDIEGLPDPIFRFFEWYEWQVLKRADAAVFVYESSYKKAKRRGISDAIKLPNAVDFDFFANPDSSAVGEARAILEKEGVDFEKPMAIYIGVFTKGYCIREILQAAAVATDWEFVLLGEGPMTDEVESTALELDNLHYPGAFEYRLMPGFLAHADVGFCFKNAEQPLKLKEYGAAGLPAIVRPGELEKWYNRDELVFVEPRSEEIARELTKLESDEEHRRVHVRNLREIAKEYSWQSIADGYEQIFIEIKSS